MLFSDGDAIGPDKEITPDVRRARETNRAITSDTSAGVEILVPVSLGKAPTADDPATDQSTAAIRVRITDSSFFSGVAIAWLVLAGLGVALLALGVVVADRFARGLIGSVSGLASTAGPLAGGDLEARATPVGPPEVRAVAKALNGLAGRIGELLTAEREAAADLSHRMRTPLMALRLEVDEVRDPAQQVRLRDGVLALSRTVDSVIAEMRRPIREGLGASCDAAEVVRERTAFWAALADDQSRRTQFSIPPGPVPVRAPASDLSAAVDVLLENVFAHTADGISFTVTLRSAGLPGGAVLSVFNEGTGTSATITEERGSSAQGSTGLGLDIAARTAKASGGKLTSTSSPRGTSVEMTLGPPLDGLAARSEARPRVNTDRTRG